MSETEAVSQAVLDGSQPAAPDWDQSIAESVNAAWGEFRDLVHDQVHLAARPAVDQVDGVDQIDKVDKDGKIDKVDKDGKIDKVDQVEDGASTSPVRPIVPAAPLRWPSCSDLTPQFPPRYR